VTFRGDTRSPLNVVVKARGFHPPISRTDRYYLENNVYEAFENYLSRRYSRTLTKEEFLLVLARITLRDRVGSI
jgi:hypothetical protein